jgi:hypothetical protein
MIPRSVVDAVMRREIVLLLGIQHCLWSFSPILIIVPVVLRTMIAIILVVVVMVGVVVVIIVVVV